MGYRFRHLQCSTAAEPATESAHHVYDNRLEDGERVQKYEMGNRLRLHQCSFSCKEQKNTSVLLVECKQRHDAHLILPKRTHSDDILVAGSNDSFQLHVL